MYWHLCKCSWLNCDRFLSSFICHFYLLLILSCVCWCSMEKRDFKLAQEGCDCSIKADTHRVRAECFDTVSVGIQVFTTDYYRYATQIKYELIDAWLRSIAVLWSDLFVIYFFKNHVSFYLDISTVLKFSIPAYMGKNSPFRCGYVALSYVLNMPCYSLVGFLVFDNNYINCRNSCLYAIGV